MRISKLKRTVLLPSPLDEENRVCDICHIRAATHEDQSKLLPIDASPRPEALCDMCWQLRQEGSRVSLNQIIKETDFIAVIKADGDSIGELLRGKKFKKFDKSATPSRLATVSRLVHELCENKLRKCIEDFGGKCLFAGGDDVLAVLSGENSLEASMRLASIFNENMAGECTMSAGVAIFHHNFPIYVGLDAAQKLIYMAKGRKGKNSVAFAIIGGTGITSDMLEKTVHPHSWGDLKKILDIANFLEKSGLPKGQIRKISNAAKNNPEEAKIWIKYLMGREVISWSVGNELMSCLESGLLLNAFMLYNIFRGNEKDVE